MVSDTAIDNWKRDLLDSLKTLFHVSYSPNPRGGVQLPCREHVTPLQPGTTGLRTVWNRSWSVTALVPEPGSGGDLVPLRVIGEPPTATSWESREGEEDGGHDALQSLRLLPRESRSNSRDSALVTLPFALGSTADGINTLSPACPVHWSSWKKEVLCDCFQGWKHMFNSILNDQHSVKAAPSLSTELLLPTIIVCLLLLLLSRFSSVRLCATP